MPLGLAPSLPSYRSLEMELSWRGTVRGIARNSRTLWHSSYVTAVQSSLQAEKE